MTTTGLTRNNPDARARSDGLRRGMMLRLIAKGVGMQQAAKIAGVSRTTLDRWLKAADEGDEDLSAWVEEATLWMELRVVETIEKLDEAADAGDWRARAWKSERLMPEIFGRQPTKVTMNQSSTTFTAEFVAKLNSASMTIEAADLDDLVTLGKESPLFSFEAGEGEEP